MPAEPDARQHKEDPCWNRRPGQDYLHFLGDGDEPPVGNPAARRVLIEEAWHFIQAPAHKTNVLRGSADYLASVLGMLEDVRDRCPALAGACCGNDHRAR